MPFQHYDPGAVTGHADALVTKSTAVGSVDVEALKGKAKAAEQIDGELVDRLDEPFASVGKDSEQISLASAFAAGVLYRWSDAITTFNKGVDGLNEEYEDKKATNLGVPDAPAGPSGGLSPGALQQQHDEDVADARAALVSDLKARHTELEDILDDAADLANDDLKKGRTEQNVLALFASGDLPEAAFPLLSALGIDPKKPTRSWATSGLCWRCPTAPDPRWRGRICWTRSRASTRVRSRPSSARSARTS